MAVSFKLKHKMFTFFILVALYCMYLTYGWTLRIAFGIERSQSNLYAVKMEEQLDLHEVFKKHGVIYKGLHVSSPFIFGFLLDKKIECVPEEINQFVLEHEDLSCNIPVHIILAKQTDKPNHPKIITLNKISTIKQKEREFYQPCFEKCYFFWKYFVLLPKIPDEWR